MTQKWNLVVDVSLCENCNNCVLAVKDEYCGNSFPGYSAPQPDHGHEWFKILRRVRGQAPHVDVAYLPSTCNHCDNAPCVEKSGNSGAIYKREDGIVIIDPVKAKGRRDLVDSCPYGSIWWNEELQLPQNWIFDAHLLDAGWTQPRPAQACPTGAIRAVKLDDEAMQETVAREGLSVLQPELGTKPRVYYKNLERYTSDFIAGTVVGELVSDGRVNAIEGAKVILQQAGCKTVESVTDAFGDFKFDNLLVRDELVKIRVNHPNFLAIEKEFLFKSSMSLGVISLGMQQVTVPVRR